MAIIQPLPIRSDPGGQIVERMANTGTGVDLGDQRSLLRRPWWRVSFLDQEIPGDPKAAPGEGGAEVRESLRLGDPADRALCRHGGQIDHAAGRSAFRHIACHQGIKVVGRVAAPSAEGSHKVMPTTHQRYSSGSWR